MTKKPPKDFDDIDFSDAMSGVRKLKPHDKHTQSPKRTSKKQPPRSHGDDDRETPPDWYYSPHKEKVGADDTLNYERPHLQRMAVKRLKQGNISLDAKLDLHQFTVDEALHELDIFLHECQQHDARYCLIVHGKGNYSADGIPVLKNMINQCLRRHPNVLAFTSAKPRHGGTGAIYVLLKSGV